MKPGSTNQPSIASQKSFRLHSSGGNAQSPEGCLCGVYCSSLFGNEENGFFPPQNLGFTVAYSEEFKRLEVD